MCSWAGCAKSAATKSSLMVHVRATHLAERFKCLHCPRTFTNASNRSRHVVKYH